MAAELWLPPRARDGFRKADPPKLGPSFGNWAGRDTQFLTLPGGGVIQFDLSKLTLADYRSMKDHYQINSSLAVLSFMIHQLDWRIEGGTAKSREVVETNLRVMWTRLIRAMSQAFWAGYSPCALEFENDLQEEKIVLDKVKDLLPEECAVNWKQVEGYAPAGEVKPKFKVYDGIKQWGIRHPIPPTNSLWYPLLMENGDYYGRKLLKPAFPSWFFSILIHLFANRYYERFGEPTPVGRADFEQEVTVDGVVMTGDKAMANILTNLRNRGVVILPSDRVPVGQGDRSEYAFELEYLESQMRGADFEKYMTRLDEEMSIGLFTPILLMRTADVGSYNLGVGHMQMYLWMLNALAGDLKEYIDRYIVTRLRDFNFGPNHPRLEWVPRKMGKENAETIRAIVSELLRNEKAKPDLEQLSDVVGITLTEVREVLNEPTPPADTPPGPEGDPRTGTGRDRPGQTGPRGVGEPRATTKKIAARLVDQGTLNGRKFKMPYMSGFRAALETEGFANAAALTEDIWGRLNLWLEDTLATGRFGTGRDLAEAFDRIMEAELTTLEVMCSPSSSSS
jgi:hypothetical protein